MYDDIATHGGRPIMWKTGHSLIKSKLKEEHAALAGEMSGHMFFADRYFGFDDAIYASFPPARDRQPRSAAASPRSSPTCRRAASLPRFASIAPTNASSTWCTRPPTISRTHYEVIEIDGVRVKFPGGWGLVRASNTQPALVTRFEASDQKTLDEIRTLFESKLKELGAM